MIRDWLLLTAVLIGCAAFVLYLVYVDAKTWEPLLQVRAERARLATERTNNTSWDDAWNSE